MNKADKCLTYVRNKQANIFIGNQSTIVILFSNSAIRSLKKIGKIVTM